MQTQLSVVLSFICIISALASVSCTNQAAIDTPTAAPVSAPASTPTSMPTAAPSPIATPARPTSTSIPAPTVTTDLAAQDAFVEYIVADEGFAISLPESWNVIELDERRFRTNMDELEARDELRAELERSIGAEHIDYSRAFYGYLPHDDQYEAFDADIRINRSALSPGMDLEALTKDYVERIESSGSITLPVEARSLQTLEGLDLSEVSCSQVFSDGRLDYRYYLYPREGEFLEVMVRVMAGPDAGEPPPLEEIAASFRWLDPSEGAKPAADGAVILSNGLITETLTSGAIRYDSTRDGFAITLPEAWTEIPLRNGGTVARGLLQFATSVDDFGWPETSPSYLDFELLAARRNTRLLWADSERKSPDNLVTLRVAAYPEEAGKGLDTLVEEAIQSIEEDSENSTLLSSQRFDTDAGEEAAEIRYSEKRTGEGEENLVVSSYYYVSNLGAYVLSHQALESEAGSYAPAVRKIAASFELTVEPGEPTSTPRPALTRRVLPTMTPTVPKPTPTPTIASQTPTPTRGAASGPYDGEWSGTTSQGKPITFTITDNSIVEFSVQFDPAVCGSGMMSDFEPAPLTGNAFEKAFTFGATRLLLVTGSVDTSGAMSGAITADKTMLCEPTTLQWSATR